MRALSNTPGGCTRVRLIDDAPEPKPAADEALVAVEAFSLNRGELALLASRPAGWRHAGGGLGQTGVVSRPAVGYLGYAGGLAAG